MVHSCCIRLVGDATLGALPCSVGSPSGPVIEFLEEWNTEALAEISPDVMITATKVGPGAGILATMCARFECQGPGTAQGAEAQVLSLTV